MLKLGEMPGSLPVMPAQVNIEAGIACLKKLAFRQTW